MISKVRARVSSAHVMAALALFVVLGGSAFAAIGKNTVGSKQLKKNAVKASKIATNAVTTAKIANDAVTGDKVLESSLGKVPSAASADSATTATNATNADNATELAGREFLQVRSLAGGDSDSTFQGLDDASFEAVGLSAPMSVPAGGADIVVSASVEIAHNAAGQHGVQCELRSDGTQISQTYTLTLANGVTSYTIPMNAFMNNVPETVALDPENIQVFCQGSIADDDVAYEEGDLTIQRIPSGA